MKRTLLLPILTFVAFICKADSWIQKADFPGGSRTDAYGFAIGSKAYVGGGHTNDLWEYDPASDLWTQKANPPFVLGIEVPAFSIDSNGFVYTGRQLWKYSPIGDNWTRRADPPDSLGPLPCYFVIGNKVYMGGGYPNYNSDFYCYDPITNVWISLANIPFYFAQSTGLTANNKGYITGFLDRSLSTCSGKVFEYNPISNTWMQKANFPGIPRTDASSFNIGNIGYFGVGDTLTGGILKDLWQYDPIIDTWISKASIPCVDGKDEDPAFVVNNKGYICFGADFSPNAEVWEYTPDSITGTGTKLISAGIRQTSLFPNPTTNELILSSSYPIISILISNLLGQYVFTNNYNSDKVSINVVDLPKGVYLLKINGAEVRKFVKE